MKPVVKYRDTYLGLPAQVGASAHLIGVVGHPAGLKGNFVVTSKVVKVDGDEIETMNTIYQKL